MTVINIGVDESHPLADASSLAGLSGLHNVQVGGIQMPAPQFVFRHRPDGEASASGDANQPGNAATGSSGSRPNLADLLRGA